MKPILLLALLLKTCGNPPLPPEVRISVTPETAEVYEDGTATFKATVVNTPDKRVTWRLEQNGIPCEPACGTLTDNGDGTATFRPAVNPTKEEPSN